MFAADDALTDLMAEIKHRPYFPESSYSIQEVAPVCGFHWSQEDVDGQSAQPHGSQRDPNEPHDLELVPDPEFREAEFREAQAEASRELQLVLDPDFL